MPMTDKVCLDVHHEGQVQRFKFYKGTPSSDLLELVLKMFHKIPPSASPEDINQLKLQCVFYDEDGDPVCFVPDVIPTNTKLYLRIQSVFLLGDRPGSPRNSTMDSGVKDQPVSSSLPDVSGVSHSSTIISPSSQPSATRSPSSQSSLSSQQSSPARPVNQHPRIVKVHRPVEKLVTQHRVPLKSRPKGCGCVSGCRYNNCGCRKNGNSCGSRCTCLHVRCCNQPTTTKSGPSKKYLSTYWTWDPEINSHPNISYTLTEGNMCVSAPVSRQFSSSFAYPVLCGTRSFTKGKHQWKCQFSNMSVYCLVGLISNSERDQIKDVQCNSFSNYPLLEEFRYITPTPSEDVRLTFLLDMEKKRCKVKSRCGYEGEVTDLPDEVWPAVFIKFSGRSQCFCRVSFDV